MSILVDNKQKVVDRWPEESCAHSASTNEEVSTETNPNTQARHSPRAKYLRMAPQRSRFITVSVVQINLSYSS